MVPDFPRNQNWHFCLAPNKKAFDLLVAGIIAEGLIRAHENHTVFLQKIPIVPPLPKRVFLFVALPSLEFPMIFHGMSIRIFSGSTHLGPYGSPQGLLTKNGFNPLSPDIKMHILFTILHTFLIELVRKICLNIKTSYLW